MQDKKVILKGTFNTANKHFYRSKRQKIKMVRRGEKLGKIEGEIRGKRPFVTKTAFCRPVVSNFCFLRDNIFGVALTASALHYDVSIRGARNHFDKIKCF